MTAELATVYGYTRSRWLDKQYPKFWERLLDWWRGL